MIDEDFAAREFAGHADRLLHSALVCAKNQTRRARLSLARAAVQDAMEVKFPEEGRVHHIRPVPAPGTRDGLGPVA